MAKPGMTDSMGAGAGTLSAFIDQGSEFEGKLSFKDTVRIDGSFVGEISSENTLIVGEPAEVQATVRSKNVFVGGTVIGDIIATGKLVLHKTAHVDGNVETSSIQIEEGAVVNGSIKMAGGRKSREGAPALKPVSGQGGSGGDAS